MMHGRAVGYEMSFQLDNVIPQALEKHQTGLFEEAEQDYRRYLTGYPSDARGLALVGLVRIHQGARNAGILWLERSLGTDPYQPIGWANLALARSEVGDGPSARVAYRKAIALAPGNLSSYVQFIQHGDIRMDSDQLLGLCFSALSVEPIHVPTLIKLGQIFHDRRRFLDAKKSLSLSLLFEPSNEISYLYLGSSEEGLENRATAIDGYKKVILISPGNVTARINRSALLLGRQQYNAALTDLLQAVKLDPSLSNAYYNVGLVHQEQGHLQRADSAYARATLIAPQRPLPYLNRGFLALEENRFNASDEFSRRAIVCEPMMVQAHVNLGHACKQRNRVTEASKAYEHALRIAPDLPEALSGMGLILTEAAEFERATDCFDRALKVNPQNAEVHYNKAHLKLLAGDYSAGWPLYEWRWKGRQSQRNQVSIPPPGVSLWLGRSPLQGKRILIWPEQGLGDSLQFCRFIPQLVSAGAHVLMEVHPSLFRLMSDSFPDIEVIELGRHRGTLDYHCPIMSLALAFSTTIETIPSEGPYLVAREDRRPQFDKVLGGGPEPKVGLVWSGGLRSNVPEDWAVNARRNIPLDQLSILNIPGLTFVSLQKGEPALGEFRALQNKGWDGPKMIDVADRLVDFADTAALLESLDLVISVDTSTAHLAGALGRPVWLLNRYDTCWRWLVGRDDSPWYPSLRQFRQDGTRSWGPVLQRVSSELEKWRLQFRRA
jgi:tetratricopeptide (TPR) repeat protein